MWGAGLCRCRVITEEAPTIFGPCRKAGRIARSGFAEATTPAEFRRQRVRAGLNLRGACEASGASSFRFISIADATMASVTKAMAPMRARVLPSMTPPSVSAVEHLGAAGLVACAGRQEALALCLPLRGSCGLLRGLQRLCPPVCRDDGGEIGQLLRLKGKELVSSLSRLKRAGCGLTRSDERGHLRAVGVEIADDSRLNVHRVLKAADRILPAGLGIGDELGIGRRHRGGRVFLLERLIDRLDVVGDILRLAEKLLRSLDRLLELRQRRIRQAGQVAGLIDQTLRLVLERSDLVVDLLKRTGRCQHILGIVRGIEDHPLRLSGRGENRRQHRERQAARARGVPRENGAGS